MSQPNSGEYSVRSLAEILREHGLESELGTRPGRRRRPGEDVEATGRSPRVDSGPQSSRPEPPVRAPAAPVALAVTGTRVATTHPTSGPMQWWPMARNAQDSAAVRVLQLLGSTATLRKFQVSSNSAAATLPPYSRQYGQAFAPHPDGGWTVHTHFRMQGSWTVLGAGRRLPRARSDAARLLLGLGDGRHSERSAVTVASVIFVPFKTVPSVRSTPRRISSMFSTCSSVDFTSFAFSRYANARSLHSAAGGLGVSAPAG